MKKKYNAPWTKVVQVKPIRFYASSVYQGIDNEGTTLRSAPIEDTEEEDINNAASRGGLW